MGGPMSTFGGPQGTEVKSNIGAQTNVDLSPRSHLISQNPETGNPKSNFGGTSNLN